MIAKISGLMLPIKHQWHSGSLHHGTGSVAMDIGWLVARSRMVIPGQRWILMCSVQLKSHYRMELYIYMWIVDRDMGIDLQKMV